MFPRLSSVFRYASLLLLLLLLSALMILQLGTSNSSITTDDIILPVGYSDSEAMRPDDDSFTKNSRTTVSDVRGFLKSSVKREGTTNPHSFGYRINPSQLCAGREVLLITYVHSAPVNFKKRQTIRETWGNQVFLKRNKVKVVFILGSVPEKSVMNLVAMEADRYGDIVQEEFIDSYRNLTYKAIAAIKWVSKFCSNAKFVLKTDDDILVNFYSFLDFVQSVVNKSYGHRRLIVCNQWVRMKVVRDKRSKWYIPKEELKEDYFSPYCSGSAYLMTSDVVSGMYAMSLETPFFWVDDYYITGILIHKMNLTHRRYNQAYVLNPGVVEDKYNSDKEHNLVFFHVHKLRTMYRLWRNMTLQQIHRQSDANTRQNQMKLP